VYIAELAMHIFSMVMQAWEDGGYSDDMTATALCNKHGLNICSPASAVFAQHIDKTACLHAHWEYLRRYSPTLIAFL
jgi:hypothetical protein